MDENKRVMDAAARAPKIHKKIPKSKKSYRYFRIPFVRSSAIGITNENSDSETNKRGWWYAHFEGQYVIRQMELRPDKAAVLLVAGVDDMQMCKYSLNEIGLTYNRDAEISDNEFNLEWENNGGKPYISAKRSRNLCFIL